MAADQIDYLIHGDIMQFLEVELDPGEAVRAETGAMIYMLDDIEMQVATGGLFAGIKRKIVGEKFFVTQFENRGHQKSRVAFAAPYPGKIMALDLSAYQGEFICQKKAFLACARGVEIGIHFQKKLGAGLFGGEGFILQKLKGDGLAFIHAGGNVLIRHLRPGEKLRVETGCVVGFTRAVDYSIEYVGGFLNPIFGGEGLFLTTLKGPGTVILQSMPFQHLADAIGHAFINSDLSKNLRK